MKTGIMLTTPGKSRFWHPCADAETGLREMAASHEQANTYGAAWDHPETVIEFGRDDGKQFTATEHVSGPKPAVKAEAAPQEPEPVKAEAAS